MARFASAFALFSALALVGCAADEDPSRDFPNPENPGKSDNPTDASELSGRFLTHGVPLSDGCGMELELEAASAIELTGTGSEFTFLADGDEVRCELGSEGAASCVFPDNPVIAALKTSLEGTWSTADRFEGVVKTSIECEGEECDDLAQFFPEVELPCESTQQLIAVREVDETFEPVDGPYDIAISDRVGELSTCTRNVLGPIPDVVDVEHVFEDEFLIDDGVDPFDCFHAETGEVQCDRFMTFPFLSFQTQAVGSFDADGALIGSLQVRVECDGTTANCNQAAAIFGEMPCLSYHNIELAPQVEPVEPQPEDPQPE